MLRARESVALFRAEERIRGLAKSRRSGAPTAPRDLAAEVAAALHGCGPGHRLGLRRLLDL